LQEKSNSEKISVKKVIIGCDHAAFELKKELITYLENSGCTIEDYGCNGERCDYPDIAAIVCRKVLESENNFGILLCGTGIGMSISANKFKGIRAAVCSEHYSVKYTRLHNNANVLCMGARVVGSGIACELAELFLKTEFEGGRHQIRIDKIEKQA
jgi:ribose 5-phosphate isomerase B